MGRITRCQRFFQHNWLDVIATIPFALLGSAVSSWTILNAFKWIKFAKINSAIKLQRLSRVSKITKEFKAASHLKREGEEYKKKHRL